jgi:hypothetical protein
MIGSLLNKTRKIMVLFEMIEKRRHRTAVILELILLSG